MSEWFGFAYVGGMHGRLLVIGFVCNLFVTRVNERHHMTDAQLDAGK